MKMSEKSKEQIREAFFDILEHKSFHNITITDITKKANVVRSTFYAHYDDKYNLLDEIEQELIGGFTGVMLGLRQESIHTFQEKLSSGTHEIYVSYFRYIRANARAFSVLLAHKSETNFSIRFSRAIAKTRKETSHIWASDYGVNELEEFSDYLDAMISSIYISTFSTWLANDMDYDEETMGKMLAHVWKSFSAK